MKKVVFDLKTNHLVKKILIVQTAFIGDVILITPLIREVKKLFPYSSIDVLVTPETSTILEHNPNVSALLLFDKRKNKFKSFLGTLKEIGKSNYDIAFSPHSSLTTGLLLYITRIPIRVGFGRWLAQKLLTHKIYNIGNYHKIEKNLRLLSPFSNEKYSMQTEIFPTSDMILKATTLLTKISKVCNKVIAIAPGSNWFTKRWPKEYYELLVNKLVELNYCIVFIGSKDERNLCEKIMPNKNSINFAGKLSIIESAAVIKLCDLMICNDSGALHIANAMQTDVMAFFGPTVKSIGYYPYRDNDTLLEIDLECRPCSTHGENICKLGHHNCMRLIEPDFVVQKVKQKFS